MSKTEFIICLPLLQSSNTGSLFQHYRRSEVWTYQSKSLYSLDIKDMFPVQCTYFRPLQNNLVYLAIIQTKFQTTAIISRAVIAQWSTLCFACIWRINFEVGSAYTPFHTLAQTPSSPRCIQHNLNALIIIIVFACSCCGLLNLEELNLKDNRSLLRLSADVCRLPKLSAIELDGCHSLVSPPAGVSKQGLSAMRKYFTDLEKDGRKNFIPVTVIGRSMAGKTSLIKS